MSKITESLNAALAGAQEKHVMIAVGLVAGGAIVLTVVLSILSMSANPVPSATVTLTCASCSHQWQVDLDSAPRCPKCGAEVGVIPIWYRCPSCEHRFLGSEVKMIGPGDFRYRIAGREEWVGYPPGQLTCPKCRAGLNDLDSAILRGPAGRGGTAGTGE